jgi:hypothetical protein
MAELWFIECGHRRRAEESRCEFCDEVFLRRKNGRKRFCSKKCSYGNSQNRVEVACSNCGKKKFLTQSKLKNSKHGHYFCGRDCKDKAQSLNGNCPDIRPSHYGIANGKYSYRQLMSFELKEGCCDCKEKRFYLLFVHHIDGDRNNNEKDNLEVVCASCHVKRHLVEENGEWISSWKDLTPREKLHEL